VAASSLLKLLKGKKNILVITHRSADIDSVASAAALFFTLKEKYNVIMGIPDHMNLGAQHFCRKMKLKYKINPGVDNFDAIIAVDVRTLKMLGSMRTQVENFNGLKIVIDHHLTKGKNITIPKYSFIKPGYLSTSHVVYDIISNSNLPLKPNAATSIAAGIIADAAGFIIGDAKTFKTLGIVLEKSPLNYSKVLSLLQVKIDISEKVAQLKAAHRNKIYNSFNHLIVTTKVGYFEASSANFMISGGADVAFAAGKDERGLILSSRAATSFVENYNFNLVKHVLKPLQKEFGGSSGGHPGAASYNASKGNLDVLLKRCAELSHEFINSHSPLNKTLKQY